MGQMSEVQSRRVQTAGGGSLLLTLIDDDKDDALGIDTPRLDIVVERLGRAVEHALGGPTLAALHGLRAAVHQRRDSSRQVHDARAGLDLLIDQRLGGRHEDDLPSREPAVIVVHDHRGDEGLAQASGQGHERVGKVRHRRDLALVLALAVGLADGPHPRRPGYRVQQRIPRGIDCRAGVVVVAAGVCELR